MGRVARQSLVPTGGVAACVIGPRLAIAHLTAGSGPCPS